MTPYSQFPWKLVALLDEDTPKQQRMQQLADFFAAPICMLDAGAGRLVQRKFRDMAKANLERLLNAGNPFFQFLLLLATNKTKY